MNNNESFEQECSSCKSTFRVDLTKLEGHNEKEEYYCPVCNKEYTRRASNSPIVTLVQSSNSLKQNRMNQVLASLSKDFNVNEDVIISNAKLLNISFNANERKFSADDVVDLIEYLENGKCKKFTELNDNECIEAMKNWFLKNYDEPVNILPFDTKEGGYQGLLIDPADYLIPHYDDLVDSSLIEKLVNELIEISSEWTPIDITDEYDSTSFVNTNKKINLIPLNKSKPSKAFLNSNIEERAQVVYNYLFKNQSHRNLDKLVFNLNSEKSKGYHTMKVLHSIGLREEHKNMFSEFNLEEVINSINDDEYEEILNILKHVKDSNAKFNGINNFEKQDNNIGQGTTNKIFDKFTKPVLNIESVAKVFSKYIINYNSEYTSTIIGIFAKWGRGKTFFYELLKKEIEKKNKKTYFCKFQPWKYQKKESAWAYLYEKILNNYLNKDKEHNSWIPDILLNLKIIKIINLNCYRIGKIDFYKNIVILFFFLALIFIPKFVQIKFILEIAYWMHTIGFGGLLIFAYKIYKFYLGNKGTIEKLIDKYGKTKDYSEYLGFQNEIEKELKYLINAYIKKEDEQLILFIDDLDRCNEKMIIDIMDSLRLVLEDDDINKKITIITAIDERILLKSIKHKYFDQETISENKDVISPKEYVEKFFLIALKLNHLCDTDKMELVDAYTDIFNSEYNLSHTANGVPKIIKKIQMNKKLNNTDKSFIKSEEDFKDYMSDKEFKVKGDNVEIFNQDKQDTDLIDNEELEILSKKEIEFIKKLIVQYEIDTPRKINMMVQRYLLFKNFIFEELGKIQKIDYEILISLIFIALDEKTFELLHNNYLNSDNDIINFEIDEKIFELDKNIYIILLKYAEMVSPF